MREHVSWLIPKDRTIAARGELPGRSRLCGQRRGARDHHRLKRLLGTDPITIEQGNIHSYPPRKQPLAIFTHMVPPPTPSPPQDMPACLPPGMLDVHLPAVGAAERRAHYPRHRGSRERSFALHDIAIRETQDGQHLSGNGVQCASDGRRGRITRRMFRDRREISAGYASIPQEELEAAKTFYASRSSLFRATFPTQAGNDDPFVTFLPSGPIQIFPASTRTSR
jgi:hypothetical protein